MTAEHAAENVADVTSPPSLDATVHQATGAGSSTLERRDRLTALLFERLAEARDDTERRRLRSEIVELNMDIARGLAWRYRGRGELLEDLEQVACLALVQAVARYDLSHGRPFQVFATPTIAGELKRYFRDRAWTIRPPRRIQELQGRIAGVLHDLQQQLHSSPTISQLAEALDEPEDDVIEALSADGCFTPQSLEAPVGPDPAMPAVADQLGAPERGFAELETSLIVGNAFAHLTDEDRRLVEMRFYQELSQRQIGEEIGMNQMAVSRALARILATMRVHVEA
uniref:RNA polymerase sigma factor SigB n=1 Tax=uncultured Nocardioidaceae bacterium TaxID=253824 RepID=A0A6J4L8F9_9ACTN|nr:MAG: RNA polymerase sigma factor SigB [uncultured Nocardioidaceae bacterium]